MAFEWTNEQTRYLINERKDRNTEYHDIAGCSRVDFWESVAKKINERFSSNFDGYQCSRKFNTLVSNYNLMCLYIAGSSRGKRSRSGELYFNEFQTQFWLRPITRFDIIRDTVMGPQRRQSRNRYAHNPPSQTLNNQRQSPSQSLGEGSSKVGK